MRGRPPKPTAVKAAEGNRGRRPLNRRELELTSEIPRPPAWLDKLAKREWKRIIIHLHNLGVLNEIDQTQLGMLCSALSTLIKARRQVDAIAEDKQLMVKTPNGGVMMNPLLSIVNRQIEIVHRLGADFGMSPVARARVLIDDAGNVPARTVTLEELLGDGVDAFPPEAVM